VRWVVVVPVKRLIHAKSRLGAGTRRRELALAFLRDTVAAALACDTVGAVGVVTGDPDVATTLAGDGAIPIDDAPEAGINPALRHAASLLAESHRGFAVAALAGDLPALRTGELADALAEASGHRRAFVCDTSGTGTTLVTAGPGSTLDPRFGPRSRAAHRASGAVELDGGWPSLRRDVDTVVDLADARRLGVGEATANVLRAIDHAEEAQGTGP